MIDNYLTGVRFSKLEINLQFIEDSKLPKYKTSAIRGGLGQAMLSQNCMMPKYRVNKPKNQDTEKMSDCEGCPLRESCLVQRFMYAPMKKKPDSVNGVESMGFTLDCFDKKEIYETGEELSFTLTLFGDAISLLMPVIYALTSFGMVGIGKDNAQFVVASVKNRRGGYILNDGNIDMSNVLVETLADYVEERMRYSCDGKVIFRTPAAIKHNKQMTTEFAPEAVLINMARKLYFYNCYEGVEIDKITIPESYIPKLLKQESYKCEIPRYSGTSKMKMKLVGYKGNMSLDLNSISEEGNSFIRKLVYSAEIIHVGKDTKLGFGAVRIE